MPTASVHSALLFLPLHRLLVIHLPSPLYSGARGLLLPSPLYSGARGLLLPSPLYSGARGWGRGGDADAARVQPPRPRVQGRGERYDSPSGQVISCRSPYETYALSRHHTTMSLWSSRAVRRGIEEK